MKRFVLVLMLCMIVMSVSALELDTDGCYRLDYPGEISMVTSAWIPIVANGDSIGDNTGFWTLDAGAGDEYLDVELDLGAEYTVREVVLTWELNILPSYQSTDALRITLDDEVVKTLMPLESYHVIGELNESTWTGSKRAQIVNVYMRANTAGLFRGILWDASVCVLQAPEVNPQPLFNGINQVLPVIIRVLAVGAGVSLAVLIIKFVIRSITGAFEK